MEKTKNMVKILQKALDNYYGKKGEANDFMFYSGHSKLTKTFLKLKQMSK